MLSATREKRRKAGSAKPGVRYDRYVIRGFELFFRPWMRRRLGPIHVRGSTQPIPTDRPALIVANHTSWWDAFIIRELHRRSGIGRPLFTLMEKSELTRFPLFRKMGVIGISSDANDIRAAIRYLKQQATPYWVTVFAQGSIWPSWKRPLQFRKGIETFSRMLSPCSVVPVSLHLEAMTAPGPAVFVGIGEPLLVDTDASVSAETVENRVEHLLDNLIMILGKHGERAAPAWTNEPTGA